MEGAPADGGDTLGDGVGARLCLRAANEGGSRGIEQDAVLVAEMEIPRICGDGLEGIAALERVRGEVGHAGRDGDRGQAGAVGEGLRFDMGEALREDQAGEAAAAGERVIADVGETF